MLIHQVTDPHIPVTGDMTVRENFLRLMDYTREKKPDLLTITGDLPGEDGSREAYEWIRDALPDGIPCLVIPGNHDDPAALFEVFRSEMNTSPAFMEKVEADAVDLLFVNTASKVLPEAQLEAVSSRDLRPGSVLFIHHPTKYISGGFMDVNYALENREEVDAAIRESSIDHVFCGHFHTEFHIAEDYNLYLTPSPAFEVDRDSVDPIIGPPRIPVREIAIEGRDVVTRVIYLDD